MQHSFKEPTGDQCEARAEYPVFEPGKKAFACWYPQMGGYVGKCIVMYTPGEVSCFEVYVWHDGEFPFGGARNDDRMPVHLHHCGAHQFTAFGRLVESKQSSPSLMPSQTGDNGYDLMVSNGIHAMVGGIAAEAFQSDLAELDSMPEDSALVHRMFISRAFLETPDSVYKETIKAIEASMKKQIPHDVADLQRLRAGILAVIWRELT